MENGIPMIWLEKPPADSLSELKELIREQERRNNKSTVLVNYQRRYTDSYERLVDLYCEKAFGKCKLIQANYSKGLETNGSHMLDTLFFVLGSEEDYELEHLTIIGNTENPSFSFSVKGGPGVIVSGIDLPYHCIDISLICENGRASILHGGMTPIIEERAEHELFPGFYRLRNSEKNLLGPGGFEGSMQKALGDLIHSHENRCRPRSDLRSAMFAQSLIDKIRQECKDT